MKGKDGKGSKGKGEGGCSGYCRYCGKKEDTVSKTAGSRSGTRRAGSPRTLMTLGGERRVLRKRVEKLVARRCGIGHRELDIANVTNETIRQGRITTDLGAVASVMPLDVVLDVPIQPSASGTFLLTVPACQTWARKRSDVARWRFHDQVTDHECAQTACSYQFGRSRQQGTGSSSRTRRKKLC